MSTLASRAPLRALLVAAQAATIIVSWPLWLARADALPVAGAVPVDAGPWLLATLALVLIRPRAGSWVHAAALAAAMLADQTRIQPSVLSLALLLVATAPGWTSVGRAHLASMWIWAGAHKLLSPGFAAVMAPWLAARLWPGHEPLIAMLAIVEIAVGVAVLIPATRNVAAGCAALLHAGMAVGLIAIGENLAMVPWNLALAGAALALFVGPAAVQSRRRPALALAAAAALFVAPAGWYVGVADAHASFVLYTGDTASTVICDEGGCRSDPAARAALRRFGAAFPPEPRLFRAHFERTCAAGETLHVTAPTSWLHPEEPAIAHIDCPDRGGSS